MTDNIEKLSFLIKRSNLLYQNYIENPIYLNALNIRKVNCYIIDFLLDKGHTFNNDEIINTIITHYEGWCFQFSEYEKPGFDLTSEFIFKRLNEVLPYPKEYINDLIKLK